LSRRTTSLVARLAEAQVGVTANFYRNGCRTPLRRGLIESLVV
jgi:hypothetical protein